MQADIGLVGLAVMGENLVLNMADHGFTRGRVQPHHLQGRRLPRGQGEGSADPRRPLTGGVRRPTRGPPQGHADGAGRGRGRQGDRRVPPPPRQGGHPDRRRQLQLRGHHPADPRPRRKGDPCYIGTGVSGGEEGALKGPSIMPGGNEEAWPHVREIFRAIAAKVDGGSPCCDWIGPAGAGHYVKMIHNGIEYGDMQLICEGLLAAAPGLRDERAGDERSLPRVEPGRARQLPDRDHRRHPGAHRRGDRAADGRRHPRTRPDRKGPASGRGSRRCSSGRRRLPSPRRCSRAAFPP